MFRVGKRRRRNGGGVPLRRNRGQHGVDVRSRRSFHCYRVGVVERPPHVEHLVAVEGLVGLRMTEGRGEEDYWGIANGSS